MIMVNNICHIKKIILIIIQIRFKSIFLNHTLINLVIYWILPFFQQNIEQVTT